MTHRYLPIITAALALLATGCATTEMHSFVDPEFRGQTYSRIMVTVQTEQLDHRDDFESIFVKQLSKSQVHCLRGLDVIPPTREYDDEQLQAALTKANVDGLLIVRMTQYYEDEYYVPQTSTSYTAGNLNAKTYYYGNRAHTTGSVNSRTNTVTSGGYTYTKPRVRHEAQLWDVASGKMAWIGGTFTKGNAYAGARDLISALAGEMKKTFEAEGLVKPRVKG